MNGYRIDWTRFVPGGAHSRESSFIRGDSLEAVRSFVDDHDVYGGGEPIVVIEHTQSDGSGRIVPAGEWDICED